MAARRTFSSLSLIRSSAASITRGPPILPGVGRAARTHQSSSLIGFEQVLDVCGVPISFRTSTAAAAELVLVLQAPR